MRSYWNKLDPSLNMSDVLMKRGNLDTDMHTRRIPREGEVRDWGDASKSQGMLKIAPNYQKLRERPGTDSSS